MFLSIGPDRLSHYLSFLLYRQYLPSVLHSSRSWNKKERNDLNVADYKPHELIPVTTRANPRWMDGL